MKIQTLLEKEGTWIQGAWAKDSAGLSIDERSAYAVCWCLEGAIERCYPMYWSYHNTTEKIKNYLGIKRLAQWNDEPGRTHKEVLDLVKILDI